MAFKPEYLLLSIAMGALSFYLAKKRGYKKPVLYFLIGFFFGLIGMAFIFFGNQPKPEVKTLSEKEIFEAKVMNALWQKYPDRLWYYLDDSMEKEKGPISSFLIQEKLKTGHITASSYLWNEELDDWISIEALIS